MKKIITSILLITISQADIIQDLKNNPNEFTKLLKEKSREERKDICYKIMNTFKETNPKLAYNGANCLLYNGYGKETIPFFTDYIYNGYNKKYFNNRIGYGWIHSADWYNVGEALTKMTNGLPLHIWMKEEIQKEVYKNPLKYGKDPIGIVMEKEIKEYFQKHKMTEKENNIFKNCKKIELSLNENICIFGNREFKECRKGSNPEVVSCLDD